jgi:DNA-binding transcriptional LysR family regulator
MPAERSAISPIEDLFGNLCYVVAAAEKRSFRQAAAELGLRESTISRGIRELEDETGVALFIRHLGGVKLT